MKKCGKCGLEKDESCFSKHKTGRNGLRPNCKDCVKLESAVYYINNKEKINKKNQEYWNENKDILNEWQKQYFLDHREEKHQYYLDNKVRLDENRRAYENDKLKNDIFFRLRKIVSSSIRTFLKKKSGKNGNSITDHLEYSIKQLKEHLEQQFEPWMSWGNYGVYNKNAWDDNNPTTWTWQIDHIIPHSTFNYTSMDSEDFRNCWALNNLRPYPAKQNIIDGVKRNRHRK